MKVFIVDDSKMLRERLVEMLSTINHLEIVAEAGNVREALLGIPEFEPDLLILDLQMPDGSGIEVLRAAKQQLPDSKVIILTNQSEPQYQQKCFELGADYFLHKSNDSNSLIEISRKLAALKGPQ